MANLKWDGRWGVLTGKAKQMWGELTNDDLDVAEGEIEELIGRIEQRTGESEERIREALEREAS